MNKELCSSRLNAELITGDHLLNFQRTIKKMVIKSLINQNKAKSAH